jgi:hypothetical protein
MAEQAETLPSRDAEWSQEAHACSWFDESSRASVRGGRRLIIGPPKLASTLGLCLPLPTWDALPCPVAGRKDWRRTVVVLLHKHMHLPRGELLSVPGKTEVHSHRRMDHGFAFCSIEYRITGILTLEQAAILQVHSKNTWIGENNVNVTRVVT